MVLCLLFVSGSAQACLWDRDTLAMERARFPEVNELIVGYFPRHSPAYYEWRKKQVLSIPLDQRTPSDFDDLGVSYDKLGEHEQAIATMLEKIERFPDKGLYETHANLGTFYIHNGDLEQGVQYIGSAIEINPEAHFGREVYQKLLVEYVIQQRAKGELLPLEPTPLDPIVSAYPDSIGFGSFVLLNQGLDAEGDREAQFEEIEKATRGILGMMRFGHHDSPILLEALGDLLHQQMFSAKTQRLAARAYLKASYEVDSPEAAQHYREKANDAIGNQEGVSLSLIEDNLKAEIAEGNRYFDSIAADEKAWLLAGEDIDVIFAKFYYDEPPVLKQSIPRAISTHIRSLTPEILALMGLGLIVIVMAIVLIMRSRRRRGIAAKLQEA